MSRFLAIVIYEVVKNPKTDTCAVCQELFDNLDIVTELVGCNHIFHFNCVKEWIDTKGTCPCCRNAIIARLIGKK